MTTTGPFHSLTDDDQARLRELLTDGSTVAAAARALGCHYRHALNFAHHHQLITSLPPQVVSPAAVDQFLKLVTAEGNSIRQAALSIGVTASVGYRLARQAGIHTRISRVQRHLVATQRRIEFLRLRLTGSSVHDAAAAVGLVRPGFCRGSFTC